MRSALTRSASGILAMLASRSASPLALLCWRFASRARSRIAARSSAVKALLAAFFSAIQIASVFGPSRSRCAS